MKFVKYPSIENMNRIETINAIIEQGFSGGEWCATNKIHGANYSFWQDDDELRSAKRSGLMDSDGGGFYGSHMVYAKYSVNMRQMFHYFKNQFNFDYMVVYGELFGGSYPHPEVDRSPGATKVQDGVFYCPHNDFYMFDIAFYLEGKLLFYSSKTAVGYTAEIFGIPAANILAKGSFEEMIALNPIFEDPLHEFFRLPKIEGNMSEGLVISPVDTKFFNGGSRVILKNKNPNFSEQKAKKERKPPKELTPDNINQQLGFLRIINRINVAMSRQKRLLIVVGDESLASDELAISIEIEEGKKQQLLPGFHAFYQLCGGEYGCVL
jgi:Rnl2 family RNA ligase